MAKWTTTYGPLAARALVAHIFLLSGLHKMLNFEATQSFVASAGLAPARTILVLAIMIEVIGGAALLAGYLTRVTAVALTAFLIPVTFVFHGFWNSEGLQQQQELVQFMKNLAIIGGLLGVSALGAGDVSLDARYGYERTLADRLWQRWQRIAPRRA